MSKDISAFMHKAVVDDLAHKPEYPRSESTQELIDKVVSLYDKSAKVFMAVYNARLMLRSGKDADERKLIDAIFDEITSVFSSE